MFRRKFLTKALAIALSASLVLGSGGFENFGTLHVQAMEQTEELSGQESVSGNDAGKSVSDSDAGKSVSDSDALGSVSGNDASDISESDIGNAVSENDTRDAYEFHYGYIASEFDEHAPTIREEATIEGEQSGVLPSCFGSVSATDYSIQLPSYMPPARSQSPYGTCWAYAAIGLAEINMAKKGYVSAKNVDYSELALAYFCYNGTYKDPLGNFDGDEHSYINYEINYLDYGGNCGNAATLFSGWVGITAESKAPYNQAPQALENGLSNSLAFDDVAHLENYYVINRETNPEYVKQAIMEYGAVSMSYFADGKYYNKEHNCFYNYVNTSTNHANVAIGWNDNFPKEYFGSENQPEGDGAWLFRNSWASEGSAEESFYQYFWVSYYDTSLSEGCYVYDVEEAANYDNNYQYDGIIVGNTLTAASGAQVANVFTAKACDTGEALEAVGFHFWDANVGYTVQIYLNPTDANDPTSGTLQETATVSGETTFAGYYTIPLKNSVRLNKGDKYAVVLTLTSDTDNDIRVGYEKNRATYSLKLVAYAQAGQSYLKSNAQYSWRDIGVVYGGNVEIKAFTKNLYENVDNFSFTDENLETEGITLQVEATTEIGIQNMTASAITWSSADESIATVKNGVVTGVAVGKTRISASLNGVEKSFEVRVGNILISGYESAFVGENKDYSYLLEKGDADISEEGIIFSSSDTSLATIDNAGRATFLRYGRVTFTVEVSGIKDSITVDISLQKPEVNCGAFSDGITKVWWDAVSGADYYVIKRKIKDTTEYVEIGRIRADGSTAYQFEDDYFKEDLESWWNAAYMVITYVDSRTNWLSYGVAYNYRSIHLNYVLNGGTLPADAPTYARRSTTVTLPTPTREGYTFEGWYLQSDFSGTVLGETDTYIKTDRTYYAKWSAGEAKNYTITFEENGGNLLPADKKSKTVTTTEPYGELPTPTRTGYTFDGWYTEETGGTRISSEQIVNIQSDTTFYAHYVPVQYYINFVDNGATKGTMAIQTVTYDTKAALNANSFQRKFTLSFSYSGGECDVDTLSVSSDFKGWSLTRDGEVVYGDQAEILNLTDTSEIIYLYAVWEDKEVTLPDASKEGYEFGGWYTNSKGGTCIGKGGDKITPDMTRTLYAHFGKQVKVNFDVNGGNALAAGESEKILLSGSGIGSLPVPTKKGYTFDGWYTQKEGGTKVGDTYTVTEDLTLYAHWTEKTIKVVFWPNGADTDGTGYAYRLKPDTEYNVPDLTAANIEKRFIKLGYELAGYSTTKDGQVLFAQGGKMNLNQIDSVNEDTKEIALYAVWKLKQYQVSFASNGSENGVSFYRNCYFNQDYTVSDYTDSSAYEKYYYKTGYHLLGYSLEQDEEVVLKASDTFNLNTLGLIDYDTTNIVFYAVWEANTYRVNFRSNGSENGKYYFQSDTKYDQTYQVLDYTDASKYEYWYKKTGYHLIGYSLNINGDVILKPLESFNLKTMGIVDKDTTEITFYAVWAPNVYTVTFDANGGEVSKGTLQVTYKEKYGVLPIATHDSYTFDGWYDAAIGGNKITEDTIYGVAADTTLYAHWKADLGDLSKYPEDYKELVEDAANRTGKTKEEIEADIGKYIPNGLWTAGIKAYDYTGVAITQPTLHVYYQNKLLTLGTDYTVKYSNNVKASGKAAVTITGKGRFTGSIVRYFTINRIAISKAFAEDIHVLFNTKVQKAAPVVSFDLNGKTVKLKKGTDYLIEYGTGDFSSEGEYIIRIVGTGNYYGTKEIKEFIEPGNKILLSKATIAKIPDQYYTGEEIKLGANALKVTYQKMTLKEGVDYTVTYRKNIGVGTAQVTITGLDNKENICAFVGSKTVTFKILGTSIAKAEVTPIPAQIYTAGAIEPALTVSLSGKALKAGQDYTVTYASNVNAGKAKVIITGINGYSGTLTKTFTITAKPLAAGDIHMPKDLDATQKYVYAYTKGGTCPEPAVICNGKTLLKNKDYTLKYSNHTASGKTAKLTVSGKGNYTGKVEYDYLIQAGKINGLNIQVADIKATGKAGVCNPVITITDVNGKKLSDGKDYYKSFVKSAKTTGSYTYAAAYEVKQKDGTTLTRKAGEKVTDTDILHVGMVLNVTLYGKGEYAGSSSKVSFRVTQNDISKATVKINKQQYTGKPIYLTNTDSSAYNYISVTVGKEVLTDKDFEIVGYENNVEKGTAKVTIHGIGNYGGYKTVSFSITPRNIRYTVVLVDTHNKLPAFKIVNMVEGTALPANSFKYTGHTFLGWSDKRGGTVIYADKAKFSPSPDMVTGSTVFLYAVWK